MMNSVNKAQDHYLSGYEKELAEYQLPTQEPDYGVAAQRNPRVSEYVLLELRPCTVKS